MTEQFANRLRALRQDRRLSQGQLGGDRYSASYISHLEKGRRLPTPEVLDYLASQLAVEPNVLIGDGVEADAGSRALSVAIPELNARAAVEQGELALAIQEAEQAQRAAIKARRPASWWTTTHIKAQSQLRLELHEECLQTVDELLRHHFTSGVPELIAEAAALGSRAARAAGDLQTALEYADLAMEAAKDIVRPDAPQPAQALLGRVAALAELGRLDEATESAQQLAVLRDRLPSLHLQGLIAWAVGNVAMMTGDLAAGLREHDAAARLLRPEIDLRAWGRFCKATAAQRIAGGETRGVERLLVNAEHALALVGNEGDRVELRMARASLAMTQEDPRGALDHLAKIEQTELTPLATAENTWLRHQAYAALGDRGRAVVEAARAARAFEEAGALPRALEAWRTHHEMQESSPGNGQPHATRTHSGHTGSS